MSKHMGTSNFRCCIIKISDLCSTGIKEVVNSESHRV